MSVLVADKIKQKNALTFRLLDATDLDRIKQKNALTFRLLDATDLDRTIQSKTSNYTAVLTDDMVLYDATSGLGTVTLYATSGNGGKILSIKKTDSGTNTVTVDGNASETIDGAATKEIQFQNSTMTIM